MPRPGVRAKGDPEKTKPYITNVPEHTEQRDMGDGFLIVACDGVWDEMSSEEAVHIVAKLILDNADDDSADIAELFIEQVRRQHRLQFLGRLKHLSSATSGPFPQAAVPRLLVSVASAWEPFIRC